MHVRDLTWAAMPVLRGDDPVSVEQCARLLAAGGLVAFPTETVYGLGARADDDAAVAGIFRAKGRPSDHPLIVHVADVAAAEHFARVLPAAARRLVAAFWPGAVTLVVERRPGIAEAAAGGLHTIGLRCPDHPAARALLKRAAELGVAGVAAPSANRFGRVSPTQARHVADEFGPDLPVLDGGACREGIESTIVDCTGTQPALLRPGTTGRAALEVALGQPLGERAAGSPRVPGSLESHYAPAASVHLAPAQAMAAAVAEAVARLGAAAVGVYSRAVPRGAGAVVWRRMPDNARDVAHELFAVLRQFDADGVRQIWVESPGDGPPWEGVRDRLERASARR